MTENSVQPPTGLSPVAPSPTPSTQNNTLLLAGLGFLITLLVLVPLLVLTQLPKKPTLPVTVSPTLTPTVAFSAESFLLPANTPNPTQMALTPLPAPTTLLKEQYDNPFDSKTQVVNPFGSSSSSSSTINPFDTLAQ